MTISNKPVVTLAAAMMLLFFSVGWYETQFLMVHFFEALIYLIMILLFFYFEDRFGYALGVFVPGVWILLQFLTTGRVQAGFRQLGRVLSFRSVDSPVSLLAAIITLTGLLLIVLSAMALRREVAGTPYLRSSLIVGGVITVAYYGIVYFLFIRTFQPVFGS